jgi:hypothetical protein
VLILLDCATRVLAGREYQSHGVDGRVGYFLVWLAFGCHSRCLARCDLPRDARERVGEECLLGESSGVDVQVVEVFDELLEELVLDIAVIQPLKELLEDTEELVLAAAVEAALDIEVEADLDILADNWDQRLAVGWAVKVSADHRKVELNGQVDEADDFEELDQHMLVVRLLGEFLEDTGELVLAVAVEVEQVFRGGHEEPDLGDVDHREGFAMDNQVEASAVHLEELELDIVVDQMLDGQHQKEMRDLLGLGIVQNVDRHEVGLDSN